jgi:MscS family membrane protein
VAHCSIDRLHGASADGAVVFRKKSSQSQVLKEQFFDPINLVIGDAVEHFGPQCLLIHALEFGGLNKRTGNRFPDAQERKNGVYVMSKHFNWCRLVWFVTISTSLVLFGSSVASASSINPLKPVDTSSPRATVKSFLEAINRTEEAYAGYYGSQNLINHNLAKREGAKLLRMLDLSEIAPILRAGAGRDAVTFLVDIIKRLELPNLESIPGDAAVRAKDGPSKWSFPETDLVIARVEKGPRAGEYLFAPNTIERAKEYFELIAGFPAKRKERFASWRTLHIHDHGWLIPHMLVDGLPASLKLTFLETPIWKIGLTLLCAIVGAVIIYGWSRLSSNLAGDDTLPGSLKAFLDVVFIIAILLGIEHFVSQQVEPLGRFELVFGAAVTVCIYLGSAWAVWIASCLMAELLLLTPAFRDDSMNAQWLRLSARVIGIAGVGFVLAYGIQKMGVPLLGLLAGLGVGGIAVALASQSTIENLIASANLYGDRPLKVGDLFSYGEVLGFVEEIGLRSTRIRGLDRTLISVPNTELAKAAVINFSNRDQMLFRHRLELRYETSSDQLRHFVRATQDYLTRHKSVSTDPLRSRVHVVAFDASAITVEVFAYIETREWSEFLNLQQELLLQLADLVHAAGTGFAFPSQTIYLTRDAGIDPRRKEEIVSLMAQNQRDDSGV